MTTERETCVEYDCGKPATHRVTTREGESYLHCDDHAGLDRHNCKVTPLSDADSR